MINEYGTVGRRIEVPGGNLLGVILSSINPT
jgi:hypothetical protein